jgi:ketosteroid isomerase-like protein
MRRLITSTLLSIAATALLACAPPAPPATNATNATNANAANTNANANVASNPSGGASKEALVALEKQAFEAWKNKDPKFFDNMLAANFMMMEGGQHMDKAATMKGIAENPCEVKSYSMSDEQLTNVSPEVAVITMKVTADVTCNGKPQPGSVTSSSVYVKQGSDWKGVFHGEVPVVDPKAASAKPMSPPPAKTAQPAPAGNADLTAKLIAREREGWDAWKNADQARLSDFVADNASAVGMMGERMNAKADIIKSWTEPCKIDSITLSGEHAVEIAPGVAMLMYKGDAKGKCGEMDVKPEWAVTVYKQNGDKWQGVYFWASPA